MTSDERHSVRQRYKVRNDAEAHRGTGAWMGVNDEPGKAFQCCIAAFCPWWKTIWMLLFPCWIIRCRRRWRRMGRIRCRTICCLGNLVPNSIFVLIVSIKFNGIDYCLYHVQSLCICFWWCNWLLTCGFCSCSVFVMPLWLSNICHSLGKPVNTPATGSYPTWVTWIVLYGVEISIVGGGRWVG